MRVTACVVVLLLALAGCSKTGSDPAPDARPPAPSGGTSDAPAVVTAGTDLLDWQPVPGPTDLSVTTNGPWTLSYDEEAGKATLTGPRGEVADTTSGRVSDALLSDDWAVVVHQDRAEEQPAVAVVTDLADGTVSTLDGDTAGAPTVNGGTWALEGDRTAYASRGPGGAYCLAEADLAAGTSGLSWCAPDWTGFNAAHFGPDGDTVLSFDDAQPACRTVVSVADGATEPLPGAAACTGFEGVLTDTGAVWSVVPDPDRIEAATYLARTDAGYLDLGPGTSGTLTRCGGATWWVRDPQDDADPARLLRWDGTALSIAYESAPGRSFLAEPRCGGSVLTVSSYSENGDEQVSVALEPSGS